MLPIDQLMKPLTKEQVKDSIYRLMTAMGLPVTSWQEGAVPRTIIAVVAAIFAGFTEIIALVIKANFLDTAEGIWLTLLAFYVYGVRRIEATFASGEVTLVNSGGGIFEFEIGEFVCKNPTTFTQYTNTTAFTLSPGQTLTIAIRAFEAGANGTSLPGQITSLVTTMLGVTCSNATAVIGRDEEKDPALRQRCRDSLGALSPNGPEAAYVYWSKSAKRTDGTPVDVNRVWVSKGSSVGRVKVIVASPNGPVLGDVNDPSTDLGAVYKTLMDKVLKYLAPFGVTLTVESAVPLVASMTWDVYVDASIAASDAEIVSAVDAKTREYVANSPIGGFIIAPASGKIFRNALIGQAERAYEQIIKADLTSPSTDISLNPNEALTQGSSVINIHRVVL